MNIRNLLFLCLAVFIFACTSDTNIEIQHSEQSASVEKTVAKIAVDGMMCEIACGGKIRKELSEMEGVASASIEYTDGADLNYALVEFNPDMVKEDQLVSCINTISDGDLYAVKKVEVIHYSPTNDAGSAAQKDHVEMNDATFKIPGISNLIQRIFNSLL